MVGLLLLFWPIAVRAETSSRVGVMVSPARLDFTFSTDQSAVDRELIVTNQGEAATTVNVAAVDLAYVKGSPQILPAGGTPYGLTATLTPSRLELAAGAMARVHIRIDVHAHKPLLGGILLAPGVAGASVKSAGIGVESHPQVVVVVSGVPVTKRGALLPGLRLHAQPVNLQLPLFMEPGPIVARATVKNDGNVYARMQSLFEFSNLGHDFLTVQAPPVAAMPGGTATTTATTTQPLQGGSGQVDTTPPLCVCRVRVISTPQLVDKRGDPVVQEAWVIVAPWRVLAVLFAITIVISVAVWRRR